MKLHLSMGGELLREVAANARLHGVDIPAFLGASLQAMYWLWVNPGGKPALAKGKAIAVIENRHSLRDYRRQTAFRISPDGLEERGGMSLKGLYELEFDDDRLLALQAAFGTDSPGETAGFAMYQWSRWNNSLREDYPGYELGLYRADGFHPFI